MIFFSLSDSKMPHYVLPIFPPLAILTARRIKDLVHDSGGGSRWLLSLPLLGNVSVIFYLIVGSFWSRALPRQLRAVIGPIDSVVWLAGVLITIVIAMFIFGRARGKWLQPGFVFGCYSAAAIVYLFLMVQMSIQFSYRRSAKPVADHFAKFISRNDRIVHYDGYLTGMPFYLRSEQPIWIVWSGTKKIVMDNIYVAQKQPPPVAGYGKVLFTFSEFAKEAQQTQQPLRIIVKTKNLSRLAKDDGIANKTLTEFGEYTLVTTQ